MAQCRQSAVEFIREAYAPMVAVLASQDAERICRKNNLSFAELIQPFCRLSTEGQIRDPNNIPHTLHHLSICVRDLNVAPPNPATARKLMNQAVASSQPSLAEGARNSVVSVGDYDLQLTASTPWYEAYRDCFFHLAQPSDHEFLKHFLACMFVVSSQHADAMEQFSRMTSQQFNLQMPQANPPPRWFCPNVFRYYVLLHDVSNGDMSKAEAIYSTMKSTYGVNACHLLQINSRKTMTSDGVETEAPNLPDPWSQFLCRTDYMRSGGVDKDCSSPSEEPDLDMPILGSVEPAAEATEEGDDMQSQSSIVIDHPLKEDTSQLSSGSELDNHVGERDSQNNALPPSYDALPPSYNSMKDHGSRAKPHGGCLLLSDHDRIRVLIQEFLVRGLLPWAERTLRTLNDQLTSRKGIHRSFFSATKKWFGGNKPGVPSPTTEKANVVYMSEAPEMQMRRMADLAFMFQLYDVAYQTYHTAKRDFNNDHAWLYYAGALEMACVSVFMQGAANQRQYPQHYMESAVSTYLNTCKNPQFATRATMLSTEALKSRGMYAEAALQLIKMTSELADRNAPWRPGYGQNQEAVDSDLRSALLLEQAGHCFINMKQPMVRKFSFHMILAGHRYSKAGQRKHALRSYSQALQVYKGKGWGLAEDHINFTIGRQSFNLRQLDNATAAFKHLLTLDSKQSPVQQNAFLREYLFVYKQQLSQAAMDGVAMTMDQLPQLPLPCVDSNLTKVLLGTPDNSGSETQPMDGSVSFANAETDLDKWRQLEELLVVTGTGSLPHNFRPSLPCFTTKTQNAVNPIAVVGEPITLELHVANPLKIPLVLSDVVLLWKFLPSVGENGNESTGGGHMITNEISTAKNDLAEEMVESQVLDEVVLPANQEQPMALRLTPQQTGELHITGLAYNLGSTSQNAAVPANPATGKPSFVSSITVRGKVPLEVQGPRLNSSKAEKTGKAYGPDRRLDLIVVPSMPRLQVSFDSFPSAMLCGEVRQVTVHLQNTGTLALHNLKVASTHPEFFTFGQHCHNQDTQSCYPTLPNSADHDSEEFPVGTKQLHHVTPISLHDDVLHPKDSLKLPLWIRGLDKPGAHQVDFLFYYEAIEKHAKLKYRVLRHTATLNLTSSIGLKAVATRVSSCHSNKQHADPISISLEVENLNLASVPSVSEVNLLQVSCASCRWHLQHLSTKRHSDIKVSTRESILLTFKAHRCHSQGTEGKQVVFTNVTFDQHQIHSAVTPCADFYFRSGSVPSLKEALPSNSNHMSSGHPPPPDPFRNLEQALQVGLTLIVLWKASLADGSGVSHMITGQHHVTLNELNIPVYSPPLAKTQVEQQPVKIITDPETEQLQAPPPELLCQLLRFTFSYQQTIKHDFSKSRLVCVPVTLRLHNCSLDELIVEINPTHSHGAEKSGAKVDLGSRPPLAQPSGFHEAPSHAFFWSGRTQTHVQMVAQASHELRVSACFSQPGVYNLATLSILARSGNTSSMPLCLTLQRPTAASLIIVENSQ